MTQMYRATNVTSTYDIYKYIYVKPARWPHAPYILIICNKL